MNEKITKVELLKTRLNELRPITKEEVKRLNEEFMIEYTYDSNAIEGSTLTLEKTPLVLKEYVIVYWKN